jgi:hypothetical protein
MPLAITEPADEVADAADRRRGRRADVFDDVADAAAGAFAERHLADELAEGLRDGGDRGRELGAGGLAEVLERDLRAVGCAGGAVAVRLGLPTELLLQVGEHLLAGRQRVGLLGRPDLFDRDLAG